MRTLIFALLLFILASCSIKPDEIEYGKDACHFCKMNIVDKTHAAQIVTKKGKSFKYDAIECMLNDLKGKDQSSIGLFLVTNYNNPTELIDATQATFLVSDSIKSPMGANLTGFEIKDDASMILKKDNVGELYDWNDIKKLFYNQ